MAVERWTVQKLAVAGAEVLRQGGIESARLDADLLLAHVLGFQRLDIYTKFDMPVPDDQRSGFRQLVRRRLRREPIAYLVGEKPFLDFSFRVTPDVLIPRPDTELCVTACADWLRRRGPDQRALEIGVGSGCIAASLARLVPGLRLIGVDVSPAALAVAADNVSRLGVEDRVELREGNLLAGLSETDFDLIVSNPPYIEESERDSLSADVRDYEPALALFSPRGALDFHRRILAGGLQRLGRGGAIVLELPGRGGDELTQHATGISGRLETGVLRDLAGRERVFFASTETSFSDFVRHPARSTASFPEGEHPGEE